MSACVLIPVMPREETPPYVAVHVRRSNRSATGGQGHAETAIAWLAAAEAAAFVADCMRLGRPPPWRDIYQRLRAARNEDDAIEVIGALRELLELEDLLIPPKLGFTRAAGPSEDAGRGTIEDGEKR